MVKLSDSIKQVLMVTKAEEEDLFLLNSLDIECAVDYEKEKSIINSIENQSCYLVRNQNSVIGYAIFNYGFNECGYIQYIFLHPSYRKKGFGLMILKHFESICVSSNLYIKINSHDQRIHNLLYLNDYHKCGVLFSIDEIRPNILYCKNLKSN